jgi:aminopeptidase N
MVRSGRHDIGLFFDLAGALASDTTPAVIDAVVSHVSYAADYLVAEKQRPVLEAWIRQRFLPVLERLGLPGSGGDEREQARRAALLQLVGVAGGAADVQRRARALAIAYIADPASLPPTIAPAVLRVAAYGGDATLYDRYAARIKEVAGQPEEYYRFFNALPYFRDQVLIDRTLAFAMSPDVRTQDTGLLLAALLAPPWSRERAWSTIKTQWSTLLDRLGTFQGMPLIVGATANFCSTTPAADLKSFFAAHPLPSAERGIAQSIERVESCAAVQARQSAALSKWLEANR